MLISHAGMWSLLGTVRYIFCVSFHKRGYKFHIIWYNLKAKVL
ncbi:hypothetical protein EI42_03855 [Thermosporothrix hazakensis]|uniref:Uncharacterized protein n=1 Tax=Thermosporothrix hazakensis TaxID=644383 RepID=A0A326U7I4_THEHA|nr:hypothetical protein EI42_03855 [Thermosporothrix hazakensis]